jgi:hypothetical protein
MIDRQTVLVLGAGSNSPYGYPTGAELRRYIWERFPNVFAGIVMQAVGSPMPDADEKARKFADGFNKSSIASIDLFLARNPDFSEFGKKAIAVSMMEAEKNSYFREHTLRKHISNDSHDWYSYLYQRMTDELIAPDSFSHFSDNKIAFLTFNYDRSFEFFLEESLLNSFQSTDPQEIREQLKKITIHHIYGCIDQLEWLGGRPYGSNYTLSDVNRLSQNIKIVHEIEGIKKETQEIIKKAERIFFLGFGYAKENLQALGIGAVHYGAKEIYGTAFGLSSKEHGKNREYLQSHFRDSTLFHNNVILEKMDSLKLLKKYL